ncbi:hypothetical protein ACPXCO_24190 [Streptomyces cyaneofuscatus]|uniref:hypothetical protein n=1 Tax=Streptomyces cyaneofuscatus TaxID=66883 RepID=UPI003CF78A61
MSDQSDPVTLIEGLAARYTGGHQVRGLSPAEYAAYESATGTAGRDAISHGFNPNALVDGSPEEARWFEVAATLYRIHLVRQQEWDPTS